MQGRIDIYVSKKSKEYYDQLEVISNINNEKLSRSIAKAVKSYVTSLRGQSIIQPVEEWEQLLKDKTKDELMELNTLITELNKTIIGKLCK